MSEVQTSSLPLEASLPAAETFEENLTWLKRLPLFQSLSDNDLRAMARVIYRQAFSPHDGKEGIIFRDNDPGNEVYFVVSGEVGFYITNAGGTKIWRDPAEEGDFFGEVALLTDSPRTATARALTPTVTLTIQKDDLLSLLSAHPDILLAMYRRTAQRLGKTSVALRQTTVKNPNDLIQEQFTPAEQRLHRLARFCGSVRFLYVGAAVLAVWIGLVGAGGGKPFDGLPFNILALIVALVSIAVTSIVLHSQNLLAEREKVRNDAETEANFKAEAEILHLNEKMGELTAELRRRLPGPAEAVTHVMPAPDREVQP